MASGEDTFSVTTLAPGVHVITELGFVHTYLVEGRDWALLIDTGLGVGNIRTEAERLTDLPVIVVNTHAHAEHIGGNHWFESVAVHPSEAHLLETGLSADSLLDCLAHDLGDARPWISPGIIPADSQILPSQASYFLSHGEAIDLGGGKVLEVLHTPGHSPGSICLLDQTSRMLFAGDVVHVGLLLAQLGDSDLGRYAETAQMLYALGWDTNLVFPGHGETPLDGGILLEFGSGFERLMDGEGMYDSATWRDRTVYDVRLGRFSVRVRENRRLH